MPLWQQPSRSPAYFYLRDGDVGLYSFLVKHPVSTLPSLIEAMGSFICAGNCPLTVAVFGVQQVKKGYHLMPDVVREVSRLFLPFDFCCTMQLQKMRATCNNKSARWPPMSHASSWTRGPRDRRLEGAVRRNRSCRLSLPRSDLFCSAVGHRFGGARQRHSFHRSRQLFDRTFDQRISMRHAIRPV